MRPSGRICLKRTAKRTQARRLSRFVIFMPSHAGRAKKNNMAAPVFFLGALSHSSIRRALRRNSEFRRKARIVPVLSRSAATDIYSACHEERRADRKTPALHCMTSSRMRRARSLCRMQQMQPDAPLTLSVPYATDAASSLRPLSVPHATDAAECAVPALPAPHATDAAECATLPCLCHIQQTQPNAPPSFRQRRMQQTQPNAPHPLCLSHMQQTQPDAPLTLSVPYAMNAAECATLPCLCHIQQTQPDRRARSVYIIRNGRSRLAAFALPTPHAANECRFFAALLPNIAYFSPSPSV